MAQAAAEGPRVGSAAGPPEARRDATVLEVAEHVHQRARLPLGHASPAKPLAAEVDRGAVGVALELR